MKAKTKYSWLLILALISLFGSAVLSFAATNEVCQIGEVSEDGCKTIHNSGYNYTLGIQNSYYGIAIFLILSLILYFQLKNPTKKKRVYIHTAIILGSLIALYFIYLQHIVIKEYCQYCLIVDFSLLISLAIILFNWKK